MTVVTDTEGALKHLRDDVVFVLSARALEWSISETRVLFALWRGRGVGYPSQPEWSLSSLGNTRDRDTSLTSTGSLFFGAGMKWRVPEAREVFVVRQEDRIGASLRLSE